MRRMILAVIRMIHAFVGVDLAGIKELASQTIKKRYLVPLEREKAIILKEISKFTNKADDRKLRDAKERLEDIDGRIEDISALADGSQFVDIVKNIIARRRGQWISLMTEEDAYQAMSLWLIESGFKTLENNVPPFGTKSSKNNILMYFSRITSNAFSKQIRFLHDRAKYETRMTPFGEEDKEAPESRFEKEPSGQDILPDETAEMKMLEKDLRRWVDSKVEHPSGLHEGAIGDMFELWMASVKTGNAPKNVKDKILQSMKKNKKYDYLTKGQFNALWRELTVGIIDYFEKKRGIRMTDKEKTTMRIYSSKSCLSATSCLAVWAASYRKATRDGFVSPREAVEQIIADKKVREARCGSVVREIRKIIQIIDSV